MRSRLRSRRIRSNSSFPLTFNFFRRPITRPRQRCWPTIRSFYLRRGFTGLSALVQTRLEESPMSGQVFIFRGRRGDRVKLIWFDGDGFCLFCASRILGWHLLRALAQSARLMLPRLTSPLQSAASVPAPSSDASAQPVECMCPSSLQVDTVLAQPEMEKRRSPLV
jgi:transposase